MATINPNQDYDIIHTLTFAEASGTCPIRLHRGSTSTYTGTVYYRAGTSGDWTTLSVSGTSTTFPVTSTTMQIAHNWNKSGNNYMTPSFRNATNITSIAISQKSFLTGMGACFMYQYARGCSSLTSLDVPDTSGLTSVGHYFMYYYAYGCSSLTSLAVPDTSSLTSVGNYFMTYYAYGCSSLTELVLPAVGWFKDNNVNWSVPSGRLGVLKGRVLNSDDLNSWKALTAEGKTLYTNYIRDPELVYYEPVTIWIPLGTFWSLDWDSPDDSLEATVTARDRMELLRKRTYQTSQVQQNKTLYQLAEDVLQDAGLTSDEYIIDTDLQNIVVPYAWFNPVSHREALRRIAEAGLAVAFQNRDGKIQIESWLITDDEPVLEITEDDYFPPLRAPSRQDQVANEVTVTTQPLRPATTPEEVYRSNEPITIPASSTKTITAFFNQPPVIEAMASLDNPPAGVSITDATYYGWGASVSIRNTNATDKQVTLVMQGKPLTVQGKERAIARDEASITENGVLTFEFPANPLVQTLAQAQAIADALLASVKESRRDIEVEWRGNPALLLGDRVTVKGKDYHVIRQELDWRGYLRARLTGRKTE